MKRDDISTIISRLKYSCDDFKNFEMNFVYEFSGTYYAVKFERENGKFISFIITTMGDEINENT
jgi:hypothetical protein